MYTLKYYLASMIMKTGHVPDEFGKGIVVILINNDKNKCGNPSLIDNSHAHHKIHTPVTLVLS